jgi:hypothetical protein
MHHEIPDRDDVRVAQAHDLHGDRTVSLEKFTAFRRVLPGWDNFENDEVPKLLIAGTVSPRQPSGVQLLLNRISVENLDRPLHIAFRANENSKPSHKQLTTAFTCRAGCQERDILKNCRAGTVQRNA